MKKVILVVLAVLLASVFLTAGDPIRLVRFDADNKSDVDVYIWLEMVDKVDVKGQYPKAYLTIPANESKTFTMVRTPYWLTWGANVSAGKSACMKSNVIGLDYEDGSLVFYPYASSTLVFTNKDEAVDYDVCYGKFAPNWWYDWYLDHYTSLDYIY